MDINPASLPQVPLCIAAAQAQAVCGDVTANIARTVELTGLAADRGAKLVVFPEKFLSGYEPGLIAGEPARYAFDVGTTGGWETCGASAIWSPYGDAIAQASRDRQEVITALLDPASLADVRERETALADFIARGDAPASDYARLRL
ncbi:nitrilase-related carbon-nitrogen hydrolase [Paraburkholderia sp. MPAMCS5]|uniref:nitrilase-related carbon-nitrogen hydrolase n=1 Tax=Paraburkholderia sp. MPAMCS5 TaxID=3112563 RepID=UPI002E16D16C|nr:nitrilase-related carbon-nitrogen hydrolase [Paraburkholderia sp. MPAMCS5]